MIVYTPDFEYCFAILCFGIWFGGDSGPVLVLGPQVKYHLSLEIINLISSVSRWPIYLI